MGYLIKEFFVCKEHGVYKYEIEANNKIYYIISINNIDNVDKKVVGNIWAQINKSEYLTYDIKKMTHLPSDAQIIKIFKIKNNLNQDEKLNQCMEIIDNK